MLVGLKGVSCILFSCSSGSDAFASSALRLIPPHLSCQLLFGSVFAFRSRSENHIFDCARLDLLFLFFTHLS